jgi:hypothetical protein
LNDRTGAGQIRATGKKKQREKARETIRSVKISLRRRKIRMGSVKTYAEEEKEDQEHVEDGEESRRKSVDDLLEGLHPPKEPAAAGCKISALGHWNARCMPGEPSYK